MNAFTFSIAFISIAQPQAQREWWEELRDDALAIVGNERLVRSKVPAIKGQEITMEEYYRRLANAHYEVHEAVRAARTQGNLKSTVPLILEHIGMYPNSRGLRIELFNSYAESRQWTKAYVAIAPELNESSETTTLLRASLASAMIGRVYEGQRQFLVTELLGSNSLMWPDYKNALPVGSSAREIGLLSLIAIGSEEFLHGSLGEYNAELFLKLASGMDWGNPLVGYMLGTICVRNGRNLEAEIYLAPASERATGELKVEIEVLLERARGG